MSAHFHFTHKQPSPLCMHHLTYHVFTAFGHFTLFSQYTYFILIVYFTIIDIAYPLCTLRDYSISPVMSMGSLCNTIKVSRYLRNSSRHFTGPHLAFHLWLSCVRRLTNSCSEHLLRLYPSITSSQPCPPSNCWISTAGGCQGQSAPGGCWRW